MSWRRYVLELGGAIALYSILLMVSVLLLQRGAMAHGTRVAVAVLPMLAGPLVAWAIVRQLRRLDELQRRIQLEALSIAFMAVAMLSMTYGFIENAGFPKLSMFVVWPFMAAVWLLASLALSARYTK